MADPNYGKMNVALADKLLSEEHIAQLRGALADAIAKHAELVAAFETACNAWLTGRGRYG